MGMGRGGDDMIPHGAIKKAHDNALLAEKIYKKSTWTSNAVKVEA